MYLPLYARHTAVDTLAQRRQNIAGWVAAPFRMDDVIQGLARELDSDLALAIHDGPSVAGGVLEASSRLTGSELSLADFHIAWLVVAGVSLSALGRSTICALSCG